MGCRWANDNIFAGFGLIESMVALAYHGRVLNTILQRKMSDRVSVRICHGKSEEEREDAREKTRRREATKRRREKLLGSLGDARALRHRAR